MFNDANASAKSRKENPSQEGLSGILNAKPVATDSKSDAFGYLENANAQAAAIEFRFGNGNITWFSYAWLGTWHFNPSEGLLLKFSGDLVYLVLLRGTNLDRPLRKDAISLTQGLQSHRILWVREQGRETGRAPVAETDDAAPIIDRIDIGQFESHDDLKAWLDQIAPAFNK